jgi:hypothetical protein
MLVRTSTPPINVLRALTIIDAVGTVPGISLGGQRNLHGPHQYEDASPCLTSLTEVFGGMWLIRAPARSGGG